MKDYKLFVDLDGVLCDFDSGVLAICGKSPSELLPSQMWSQLARSPGFYDRLQWTQDGHLLWDSVKDYKPTILTGLPRGNWAEGQKRSWCRRELGPDVPVVTCLSREKALRASSLLTENQVAVLVDDRLNLKEDWQAIGGIFVWHQNSLKSLQQLAMLGFKTV